MVGHVEAANDLDWAADRVAVWYRTHVDAVHAYLARRVGDQLAVDLVAETFRIAVEQQDRFDPARGSERAWFLGIATNLVRRHWRTETRRLRAWSRYAGAQQLPVDPLLAVAERVDAAADVVRLFDAVANLDPVDRDLLVLIAWEGCSYRDAAGILDVPTGTVKSRLHRIRDRIRTEMSTNTAHGDEIRHG